MTQFIAPEQFVAASKANVETLTNLANSQVARAERLASLNLNTARAVVEDAVAGIKTVLAVKNPQELIDLQSSLAQPLVDKSVAYARSVYDIVSEGQQEIAKLIETQIAELNKAFNTAIEQAAKAAPAGSEGVFTAIKSAVAASNSAYDEFAKATKQLTAAAEANFAAANQATVKAISVKKAA